MNDKSKHGFFPGNTYRSTIFSGTEITPVRDKQNGTTWNGARFLTSEERILLEKNRCQSENWDLIQVKEPFNPELVINCVFKGVVRIGKLEKGELRDYERSYPCGLYDSTIISSDIGNYCSIIRNSYISEIITGDYVILADNSEIFTTENGKFGNCILKTGENPDSLRKTNLVNERGGRNLLSISSMRGEDVFIWIRYRNRKTLMQKLEEMTLRSFDPEPGYFSYIDNYTLIKGCRHISDIFTGRNCRITGVKTLENVTILSTAANPVSVSDSCCVRHGTISEGAVIEKGCMAENFFLSPMSRLSEGVRLNHTYLGSSSTLSGCEVQNSFIFPCHEQHHSNSLLIAAVVMGQSNIAAGSVLGSNHNGRMNDCEMWAGRGFWSGLCSSVRYNSRFASFTLLTKSDFPGQLDIRFPFSLVNNNPAENCLEIIPAYWWLYNMYALFRNFFKFRDMTSGIQALEGVEMDFLAPDTVEEIIQGLLIIEEKREKAIDIETEFRSINLDLQSEGIEGLERIVKILRFDKSARAYREMIIFYCGYNIFSFINQASGNYELLFKADFSREHEKNWVNLCGRLIGEGKLEKILCRIESGEAGSWDDIHALLDSAFENYSMDKLAHAVSTALTLYDEEQICARMIEQLKTDYYEILLNIEKEIIRTRLKDYHDPMRENIFISEDEMDSVIGKFENDPLPGRFRHFFIDMLNE